MLKEVTYYTITCNECGREFFEDDEFTAYSDKTGAIETFAASYEAAGWWTSPDNKIQYCDVHSPQEHLDDL